jgi:TrbM
MRNYYFAVLTTALSASLAMVQSAVAQEASPTHNPTCGIVLCLAQHQTPPDQCKPYVDRFFDIKVYRNGRRGARIFDPGATMSKRADLVYQCNGAENQDKANIINTFGPLEYSPFF